MTDQEYFGAVHACRAEAQDRIARGESPAGMVHFIDDNPERGLSSAISFEDFARGGYTSHYFALGDIATWGAQA